MKIHISGWRKSHYGDPDGHCIEAGRASDGTIGVRETKLQGDGSTLEFSREEWRDFLSRIRKNGH